MTAQNTQTRPARKPQSDMLRSFKEHANPLYTDDYGLALNNVNFWKKYPDMQYILVFAGGTSITFVGEAARNVLYNLGDRDSNKFHELSAEDLELVNQHLANLAVKN